MTLLPILQFAVHESVQCAVARQCNRRMLYQLASYRLQKSGARDGPSKIKLDRMFGLHRSGKSNLWRAVRSMVQRNARGSIDVAQVLLCVFTQMVLEMMLRLAGAARRSSCSRRHKLTLVNRAHLVTASPFCKLLQNLEWDTCASTGPAP